MILALVLLSVIFVYYISLWLWRRLKNKNSRLPPQFPGYLPLVGHAHLLYGDTIHLWHMIKKLALHSLDNGGVTTIYCGNWRVYMITDPEDCYTVGSSCLHKDAVYSVAKAWLGDGLVTASVNTWKRHRKLVNPAFSQHVIDGYLTVFNTQSRQLVETLEEVIGTGSFDHTPFMEKTALEIICLTAMGIDSDDNVLNNVQYMGAVPEIFHVFVERVQSLWMQSNFLFNWTTLKKKQDELVKVLHDMSNTVIQKRKVVLMNKEYSQTLENTPKRFKSFLDLLLESSMDGSLSDNEIREEVDTMISAGYDTSATLLTIVLVLIGSYPEVQDRIYKELQEVFEGSDRDVEKQDLPKLVYTEAVLKECLRLYPVVPLVARYLKKDVELKNYTISAGSSCFFLMYGIHRHSMWGADAETFRPERWLNPDELPSSPNAFAGFSLGRRTCIGQKFALMSAKTTLSYILRHYRVSADHRKMILKMDIMLKPETGHHITLERR